MMIWSDSRLNIINGYYLVYYINECLVKKFAIVCFSKFVSKMFFYRFKLVGSLRFVCSSQLHLNHLVIVANSKISKYFLKIIWFMTFSPYAPITCYLPNAKCINIWPKQIGNLFTIKIDIEKNQNNTITVATSFKPMYPNELNFVVRHFDLWTAESSVHIYHHKFEIFFLPSSFSSSSSLLWFGLTVVNVQKGPRKGFFHFVDLVENRVYVINLVSCLLLLRFKYIFVPFHFFSSILVVFLSKVHFFQILLVGCLCSFIFLFLFLFHSQSVCWSFYY